MNLREKVLHIWERTSFENTATIQNISQASYSRIELSITYEEQFSSLRKLTVKCNMSCNVFQTVLLSFGVFSVFKTSATGIAKRKLFSYVMQGASSCNVIHAKAQRMLSSQHFPPFSLLLDSKLQQFFSLLPHLLRKKFRKHTVLMLTTVYKL